MSVDLFPELDDWEQSSRDNDVTHHFRCLKGGDEVVLMVSVSKSFGILAQMSPPGESWRDKGVIQKYALPVSPPYVGGRASSGKQRVYTAGREFDEVLEKAQRWAELQYDSWKRSGCPGPGSGVVPMKVTRKEMLLFR